MKKKEMFTNKVRKFAEEGLTIKEIAEKLNVSTDVVRYQIKKIKMQDAGLKVNKFKLDELDYKILDLAKELMPRKQIADILGVPVGTVVYRINRMRKHDIEIPKMPLKKIDELDYKILDQRKNNAQLTEIAEMYGVTITTISNRIKKMKEFGIEVPPPSLKRKIPEMDETDNKILGLLEKKMQYKPISRDLGISVAEIHKRVKKMRALGIEIPRDKEREKERNLILDLLAKGYTHERIADELGLTQSNITVKIDNLREKGYNVPPKRRRRRRRRRIEEMENNEKTNILEVHKVNEVTASDESTKNSETRKPTKEELMEVIKKLINTREATPEQLKIIAGIYGIDLTSAEQYYSQEGIIRENTRDVER